MRDGILGIDLGTSGVKVIVTKNGREQKSEKATNRQIRKVGLMRYAEQQKFLI